MNWDDANTAVLEALGIPYKGKYLVAVTVRIRYDKLPIVHTVSHIPEKGVPHLNAQRHRFTLTPADPEALQPFDLDAACDQALRRVNRLIDGMSVYHRKKIEADFCWAKARLKRGYA